MESDKLGEVICVKYCVEALSASISNGCSIPILRPVKPCPGVPGIHLNAEYTVSMTAALLCGARASPVHKVSLPLSGSRSALVS